MNNEFAIRSVLEILILIALLVGLAFEDKIAEWEQNLFKKIAKRLKGGNK